MSNKLKKQKKTGKGVIHGAETKMSALEEKLNARLEAISDRDQKRLQKKNNILSLFLEAGIIAMAHWMAKSAGVPFPDYRLTFACSIGNIIISAYCIYLAARQISKFRYAKKTNSAIIALHGLVICACLVLCIIMLCRGRFLQ